VENDGCCGGDASECNERSFRVRFKTIRLVSNIIETEAIRAIWGVFVGREPFGRKPMEEVQFFDSLVGRATPQERSEVIAALTLVRSHSPVMETWFAGAVGKVGVVRSRKKGVYFSPDTMVMLTRGEVEQGREYLACLLARRIALNRIVRARRWMPPPMAMRAYIHALLREEKLARSVSMGGEQYDWILQRLERWKVMLEECSFSRRSRAISESVSDRVNEVLTRGYDRLEEAGYYEE
jgi:hypothetical protein